MKQALSLVWLLLLNQALFIGNASIASAASPEKSITSVLSLLLNGVETGVVCFTLLSNATGQPVANALITVGPSSGVTSYYGEVTLTVPVRIDPSTDSPVPERVVVSGSGIYASTVTPIYITPIANATIDETLFIDPYVIETGTGVVRFTLRSNATGQPVVNARITVGSSSGVTSYYGEVTLTVPVQIDLSTDSPVPERVVVSGSGIDASTVTPVYITPIANATINETLFIDPYVAETGTGVVRFTLLSNATGQPVANALITVGPSSGVTSYDGEVTLTVPARIDLSTDAPVPERVAVSGSGIDASTVTPMTITPIANATINETLFIDPHYTVVTGRIQSASYNTLYLDGEMFNSISITTAEVALAYLQPNIDPNTGNFSVRIPEETPYVYLLFSSPYFSTQEVGPVYVEPGGGNVSLSAPVTLIPLVRDVEGFIVDSYGSPITDQNGSMTISLGKSADYLNGSFLFRNVPVGLDLRIDAWVFNGRNEYAVRFCIIPVGLLYYDVGTIITSP